MSSSLQFNKKRKKKKKKGNYEFEVNYEHNDKSPSDPPPNVCRIRKCYTTMDASHESTLF